MKRGAKPYGFRPGEQEVVDHILGLRKEGLAVDRIAARLNSEGVKPRRGALWGHPAVRNVLRRAGLGRRLPYRQKKATIEGIHSLRALGLSCTKIANWLNAKGVKPALAPRWTAPNVWHFAGGKPA